MALRGGRVVHLFQRFKSFAKWILLPVQPPGPVWDTPRLHRYPGYTPDDLWVFDRFRDIPRQAEPGFLKDYLGVRTRPGSLAEINRPLAGHLQDLPVPGDWHAEAIEHIGLLKSVLAAKGSYHAMELGAGWGPWLISGAVAAQHIGIQDIHLLGVEADTGHFAFLLQHFKDNGFNPDQHLLLHAAVGAQAGMARFPRVKDPANQWGARPSMQDGQSGNAADQAYLSDLMTAGQAKPGHPTPEPELEEVPVVAINDLLRKSERWDLVHIDVQGWEMAICSAGLEEMNRRVRYLVVGTHSRKLDGDLVELFHRAGWQLEHEKPTQFSYTRKMEQLENMTVGDGTQVWRNPRV